MIYPQHAYRHVWITSMPVVRTGVYPHMPIAVTANSLQHWLSPSKQWRVSHTVRGGRESLSHKANDQTCYRFFNFWPWGLPLGPRSPKGEMTYYPPRSTTLQNFSPIAQTVYEICVTKVFHFLAPGGLTPRPKFTKRGDDLADYEIYHPAKFHRSMPTHARDIRYQNSCGQTEKQTKKQ